MGFESPKFNQKEQFATIAEAEEEIAEMFENGIRPEVTIGTEFVDTLKNGLKEKTSWIPGSSVIACTMGTDPYIPKGEERVVVRVNVDSPGQIHPRCTGPDKAFHGVVTLNGPIPPESIEIVGQIAA